MIGKVVLEAVVMEVTLVTQGLTEQLTLVEVVVVLVTTAVLKPLAVVEYVL
jgi:hypothetical protein